MKIEIKRRNDLFHMEAENETGNVVQMDASPEIGGLNMGMRPMQLLLAALGGCGSIDIISILRKQKEPLDDIRITVTGEREAGAIPALFTDAHVHIQLFGNIDLAKAERAVNLSMEKYCSVAKTMEKTAKITHSFEIIS